MQKNLQNAKNALKMEKKPPQNAKKWTKKVKNRHRLMDRAP